MTSAFPNAGDGMSKAMAQCSLRSKLRHKAFDQPAASRYGNGQNPKSEPEIRLAHEGSS